MKENSQPNEKTQVHTLTSKAQLQEENKKLTAYSRSMEEQIAQMKPVQPSSELQGKLIRMAMSGSLSDLRKLNEKDLGPRDVIEAQIMIQGLISRIESQDQAIQAIKAETISEKEHQKILSQMSSLKIDLMKVEVERNTLSEALRIACSHGKVDPVKEGQAELRALAGEAHDHA